MGISVKINCYYFTGLQYDSKRVLPNHMLNVRHLSCPSILFITGRLWRLCITY